MQKERRIIALVTNHEHNPKSNMYPITKYVVNPNNRFKNELSNAGGVIKTALNAEEEVLLFARAETGTVAVAAFAQYYPSVTQLVMYWSAFDYPVNPFEQEAAVWLKEHKALVKPLLGRITTVYTKDRDLQDEHGLQGARRIEVSTAAPDWTEGLKRLMWHPVDEFLNPDFQK